LQQLTADLEQRVQDRTARLEEVNRELEGFAYTVSHDLRAPLRAINGYARLLDEDYGPDLPQDARDMLAMLRKGAARMNTRIDDLLRLADRPLHRRQIAMRPLAESAAQAALAGCTPGRCVNLQIDDLPPAHADQDLVERVFTNLLDNALKYTRNHPQARIHIGAQQNDGRVVYFVADNGIGFEMSAAERIFAPFQRLHAEQVYEGSGLGLASARRIIERHGGRIWADSCPGQGATFFFTLAG
jgi:light-regulated signal transduction histidine kinase (bacteriophytochrome)